MDDSNQNAKPPTATIDISDIKEVIDEMHLVLTWESNTSSKITSSINMREALDSAYEAAVGASQSELEFPLKTNANSENEDFSHATDIINKEFRVSKKLKLSRALLDGSNGQQNAPSQEHDTDMILKLQELTSIMEAKLSLKVKGEDEMKRERWKQANRESVKMSRLRKRKKRQELEARANNLDMEVSILTEKLSTLAKDCAVFTDDLWSITKKLKAKYR